jgi:hypothetical protein
MEVITGTYKNGRIRLSKKPRTKKEMDVTVYFNPKSKNKIVGLTGKETRELVGLFHLGGNALIDTEKLYE